ncbi:caspase family protein [Rhizobium changzhiense]|uniref:Caspase family protein n=1 Tax=Rhizobium changzhiense TaxID=2692317 RepID=A0ABR6A3F3_9HYPH|nr:caspase family protein [Rhizobium changzhiense]MBA5801146.1 caspase family protein [Rhizobium changzhiense]NNU50863.1 caspase family protein [Rhizobium changzhiense]
MDELHSLSLVVLRIVLFLGVCSSSAWAQNFEMTWSVPPQYRTPGNGSTAMIIKDSNGVARTIYDESYAVLIIQGQYSNGWSPTVAQGERSASILRKALEARGYHVMIWRDLKGQQFQLLLSEILSNIGYRNQTRLLFYYFGHGTSLGTSDDDAGTRTFLVPVDAGDPSTNPQGFYRSAIPISRLTELASAMTIKHAFFALEACNAGGILSTLGLPPPPNAMGYIFGENVKKHVRQFLTAGNEQQEVPTGVFSALLVGAFDEGSRNDDGYVTGSDVISYVTRHSPQFTKDFPLNPSYGFIPPAGGGDMVIGPSLAKLHESNQGDSPPVVVDRPIANGAVNGMRPAEPEPAAPSAKQKPSSTMPQGQAGPQNPVKRKTRIVSQSAPPKSLRGNGNVSTPRSSGKCFKFNGQTFCE